MAQIDPRIFNSMCAAIKENADAGVNVKMKLGDELISTLDQWIYNFRIENRELFDSDVQAGYQTLMPLLNLTLVE